MATEFIHPALPLIQACSDLTAALPANNSRLLLALVDTVRGGMGVETFRKLLDVAHHSAQSVGSPGRDMIYACLGMDS